MTPTDTNSAHTRAARLFTTVVRWPRAVIVASLVPVLAAGIFLPRLTLDSRNMSNVDPAHPARIATERIEDIFGLSANSTLVVAIVRDGEHGVFTPNTLGLVAWLTDRLDQIEGVEFEEITSLTTERNIVGTTDDMVVEPFFENPPKTQEEADRIRRAVLGFDLVVGRLVSRDETMTAILVDLLDEDYGREVYEDMSRLVAEAPVIDEEIHIAGIGAFNARLGDYMEKDGHRLNPIAALVIVTILIFAYRTVRGTLIPLVAVLAAVATAFGTMAALGVPVYTVTNTMSVILIAIGVCDGIHILGQYYAELSKTPHVPHDVLIVRVLVKMWRPVLVTSLTTAAGLLAVSAIPAMPPMRHYGAFASIGVMAALTTCLFTTPAILVLLKPKPSRAFLSTSAQGSGPQTRLDRVGRLTAALGRVVYEHPREILTATVLVLAVALIGAGRVRIDNAATNYLAPDEPLRVAQHAIEKRLGATLTVDIVVETDRQGGLYEPDYLKRIESAQAYVETLPHVTTSMSIVDYVKQMHRAMHSDRAEYYSVPDDRELIAQYFLTYSMSSSPSDFDHVVDYAFQRANVRVLLDSGRASNAAVVVRAMDDYLRTDFAAPGIGATLAGWATISASWLELIERSQVLGIPLAFLAVGLVTTISFRSVAAGTLSLVPVAVSVLLMYAVMGFTGIWLDMANTILAALALGVTVDFSIHTLDRLIVLMRTRGLSTERAFLDLYSFTGRALVFNFVAIAGGFSVIMTSVVPPLRSFGLLVVVGVTASFVASVTLLPALILVLKPRFVRSEHGEPEEILGERAGCAPAAAPNHGTQDAA